MFALIKCVFPFCEECLSRMPGERHWTIDQKHTDGSRIWQWGWDQRGEGWNITYLLRHKRKKSWTRAFVLNCWSNGMRSELPGLIPRLPLVKATRCSEGQGLGLQHSSPLTAWPWDTQSLCILIFSYVKRGYYLTGIAWVYTRKCT